MAANQSICYANLKDEGYSVSMSSTFRLNNGFVGNYQQIFYQLFRHVAAYCKTANGGQGICRPSEECIGFSEEEIYPSSCQASAVCCPRRYVSKIKCEEYGKAVFVEGGGMGLVHNDDYGTTVDECGISATPLIVGGERASLKEFPHMAAIGYGQTPDRAQWMCGGSLISELYVLTAAHCLQNDHAGGRPKFVKLGVLNIHMENHRYVQIREIVKHIYHPHYNREDKYNDIGLLRLNREVNFSPVVRPACLDYNGIIKENTALATGWGKTSAGDIHGNPDLLKVQLNIINVPQCTRAFRPYLSRGLQNSQLCAGNIEGGKDTCQGDSGGPLQTIKYKPFCMYKIIGVTSFGLQCGSAWSPAIYSRVFAYLTWIEHTVWPSHS